MNDSGVKGVPHIEEAEAAAVQSHRPQYDLAPTALSRTVDPILTRIGEAFSWVWVVLVGVVLVNVVMRYALGKGLIQFEEAQWHLYAVGFMLGLAYVTVRDQDVRIDVLSERWSLRTRTWIELYGMVLFLLPFIAIVLWFSWPFVAYSLGINERSDAPGGLPLRWLIKSVLTAAFMLLALAALSRFSRVLAYLFLDREPVRRA